MTLSMNFEGKARRVILRFLKFDRLRLGAGESLIRTLSAIVPTSIIFPKNKFQRSSNSLRSGGPFLPEVHHNTRLHLAVQGT